MKKSLFLIAPLLMLASCTGGAGSPSVSFGEGAGSPSVSFKNIYNDIAATYASASTALSLGSDYSYLRMDSNPYDVDGGTTRYIDICHDTTIKCGFTEATWQLMLSTRALDGTQTDTASNGVKARWTYHPDKGLECVFTH